MAYQIRPMTIHRLMSEIDLENSYYLPAIQRPFVWSPEKTQQLFDSILCAYPIGSFLRWCVAGDGVHEYTFYELIRNWNQLAPQNPKANLTMRDSCYGILDGQQRITSLYTGLLGSRRDHLPRTRKNDPRSYPERKLYMDLLKPRVETDSGMHYAIEFRTEKEASEAKDAYWYRMGDILAILTRKELRTFRRSTPYADNATVEDNLDALWTGIHEQQAIIFLDEERPDLDEVLNIFVLLNTGGEKLNPVDILQSLLTATWKDMPAKDMSARDVVENCVKSLNTECGSFGFEKDLVLKALLVLGDVDVRFKVANIRRKHDLQAIWGSVDASLRLATQLITSFGFNWTNLSSSLSIIPIAYYIHRAGHGVNFLTSKAYESDRETIRVWLLRILIGRVFRAQTDAVLTTIRSSIQGYFASTSGPYSFPADAILRQLRARQYYSLTDESLPTTVEETTYNRGAFAILTLLFPDLNFLRTQFHVDHLHPAAHFTRQRLTTEGMSEVDIQFALTHYNSLANLHLLPGPDNLSKNDTPLAKWLTAQRNPDRVRDESLIPNVDLSLANFGPFYEARKQLLTDALADKLGVSRISTAAGEVLDPVTLVS